ncbi:MAG: GNAT family N-acetyltransferase [Thermoplasmatota archaeon]
MTNVRLAEPGDLARIVEMGVLFVAESPYGRIAPAVPGRIAELASRLATSSVGVIFVSEVDGKVVGMIGGHVFDHPMLDAIVASEVAWWLDPPFRSGRLGVELMRRFEQWASDMGATHVEMVAPNERVGQFYERVGYTQVETAYVRRV